jgi:hypothetical protein
MPFSVQPSSTGGEGGPTFGRTIGRWEHPALIITTVRKSAPAVLNFEF